MKNTLKKAFAIIVVIAITLTLVPASASFAASGAEFGDVTIPSVSYNGQDQSPTNIVVKNGDGTTLTENVDYTVESVVEKDAGTYPVKITGIGDYSGKEVTKDWTITPRTVRLYSASNFKKFDDTPLTAPEVYGSAIGGAVDSVFLSEVSDLKATGSVTTVGQGRVANTIVYTPGPNFKIENYDIDKHEGELYIEEPLFDVQAVNYDKPYDGESHSVVAIPGIKAGTTIWYSTDGTTWTEEVPKIKDVGVINVYVEARNPAYVTATCYYTLKVTKRVVNLYSETTSKAYDGTELTAPTVYGNDSKGEVDSVFLSEVSDLKATGSVTTVGEGKVANTITFTGKTAYKESNYDFKKTEGTLSITARTMTVSGTNYSGAYDGQSHGVAAVPTVTEGTKVKYSIDDGTTWTEKVPKITDAGKITVKVKTEKANYTEATCTYTLEVTKRVVNLYSETTSKVYDGTELTAPTVYGNDSKGEVDSVFLSEVSDLKATGSVTTVGEGKVANTITYTGKTAYKESNYDIKKTEGTLSITAGTMTVSGTNYSGAYDGKSHGVAAVPTVTEGTKVKYSIDDGTTWTEEVPKITNAGKITVKVKTENPNYIEATCTYTLEVTKRTVTITADDKTKVAGEKDPEFTGKVEGLEEGEKIDITYSRTDGENAGDYVITPLAKDNANYTFDYKTGKFTITPAKKAPDTSDKNNFGFYVVLALMALFAGNGAIIVARKKGLL